ncbi:MAG: hypothetical protein BM557_07400 [Flavobacterium sp. MedPE-SWcel]|nr:MAG: hypothetical protein BM557_07400 [Flavobacterium sp. MedPE-SWcel]
MITIKNKIRSKRLIYISGYIATTLISTGWFFKIMHWPFAGILLALGFAILIILFFPTFFYNKYKSSERKLYE